MLEFYVSSVRITVPSAWCAIRQFLPSNICLFNESKSVIYCIFTAAKLLAVTRILLICNNKKMLKTVICRKTKWLEKAFAGKLLCKKPFESRLDPGIVELLASVWEISNRMCSAFLVFRSNL